VDLEAVEGSVSGLETRIEALETAGFQDIPGTLKIDSATSRDTAFQVHIAQDRVWVKHLLVDALAANAVNILQSAIAQNESDIAALETRATTIESDATALTARV